MAKRKGKLNISESDYEIGEWVQCTQCEKMIRSTYVDAHNKKKHSKRKFVGAIAERVKRYHRTEEAKKAQKQVPKKPAKLKIVSKRGTVIYGAYRCSTCDSKMSTGWRYTSSKGILHLCGKCKSYYVTAGNGIGMLRPRFIVTNMEINRRRH